MIYRFVQKPASRFSCQKFRIKNLRLLDLVKTAAIILLHPWTLINFTETTWNGNKQSDNSGLLQQTVKQTLWSLVLAMLAQGLKTPMQSTPQSFISFRISVKTWRRPQGSCWHNFYFNWKATSSSLLVSELLAISDNLKPSMKLN